MESSPDSKIEANAEFFLETENLSGLERALFQADVRVNAAYCNALFHAGVLTRSEAERIKNGLQAIIKRAEHDRNYFDELTSQDVHSFVNGRLIQLIGETGRKLSIGRNKNEQLLTTLRLWMRREIEKTSGNIKEVQKSLIETGEQKKEAFFPVLANLQKAQPILWAHWCLAYFEMLERDRERLDEAWRRVNVSPFGAENSFEIDREEIAAALDFEGIIMNGFDAASDTDFIVEFTNACAILMRHLTRFADEIIISISKEFGFVELKDKSVKGRENILKSLNLLRRKSNRVLGNQVALLSAEKNLPLSNSNNLQEEKESLFDTVEIVKMSLKAANLVVKNLSVNEAASLQWAKEDFFNVSEITDYLLNKDMPFESADNIAGKIVNYAVAKNRQLNEISLSEFQSISPAFEADVFQILDVEHYFNRKIQIGGTAPERVYEALEAAKESLEREQI